MITFSQQLETATTHYKACQVLNHVTIFIYIDEYICKIKVCQSFNININLYWPQILLSGCLLWLCCITVTLKIWYHSKSALLWHNIGKKDHNSHFYKMAQQKIEKLGEY